MHTSAHAGYPMDFTCNVGMAGKQVGGGGHEADKGGGAGKQVQRGAGLKKGNEGLFWN